MSVYTDLTATFTYNKETVFGDFSKLANNDQFLKDNGWQDGTVGIFFQAAAPTGWTKITTQNAQALRVVAGAGGGAGGANDPGANISLAHTHTVATDSNHTHQINSHSHHLATNGLTNAAGTAVKPIYAAGDDLKEQAAVGSSTLTSKANTLAFSGGPYTTGAGGNHNHGGASDSQLGNISLAYANVIFCSKNTSTGYVNLTTTFVHNVRHVFDYLQELAINDSFNYARRTPAGTVSIFYSSASPVGWTKVNTNNAQLLRIVNDGTGTGTGGVSDPASAISLAHTHTLSSDGAHTHSSPAHIHKLADKTSHSPVGTTNFIEINSAQLRVQGAGGIGFNAAQDLTNSDGSGTTSSDGAHTHTTGSNLGDINLAYVNVIQASKDSGGAPAAYTDYTAFFVDQALLAYQDLQVMANNDAYLNYHTMPTAAAMFFFQAAAPLTWTKLTTQDDRILRIVSDSSGGTSGGVDAISGISLAHTHTIPSADVSHTFAHTHTLSGNGSFQVIGATPLGNRVYGANDAELYSDNSGGAGDTSLGSASDSQTLSTDTYSHAHGGATGSSLTTLSLAHTDIILCSKN